MKFILIKTSPLEIQRKAIDGFPAKRERDNLEGTQSPDGYKYIPDEPQPSDTLPDGMMWVRELMIDAYGWQLVAAPVDEIDTITVTSAQFKCALGVTRFTQIESVLAAMPDADEQFEYTQYWLNTTEFNISHPMVVAMQSILGWSDADRDQLFIDAGNK